MSYIARIALYACVYACVCVRMCVCACGLSFVPFAVCFLCSYFHSVCSVLLCVLLLLCLLCMWVLYSVSICVYSANTLFRIVLNFKFFLCF